MSPEREPGACPPGGLPPFSNGSALPSRMRRSSDADPAICCGAPSPPTLGGRYLCTEPDGHKGPHVARGSKGGEPLAEWTVDYFDLIFGPWFDLVHREPPID